MAITKQVAEENPLALSDFSAGGGIFPEGRYRITEAVFCEFDYEGKAPKGLAFRITAQSLDNPSEKPAVQHYSCGKTLAGWVPNPHNGGHSVTRVPDTDVKFIKGSNFYQFLNEAVNSGLSEEAWKGNTTIFEGMEARFKHIPLKEITNRPTTSLTDLAEATSVRDVKAGTGDRVFPKTLPVICEILPDTKGRAPGAKVKSIAKVNGTAAHAPAAATVPDQDVLALLVAGLDKALDPNTPKVGRSQVRLRLYSNNIKDQVPKDTNAAIINAFLDDTQLGMALLMLAENGKPFMLSGTDIILDSV